jgi:protein O-GlcNAcase/histone acetyltransferase
MWTGDKVISKIISRASLEDITEVLKRPCIIWDNEHANDYDQKRVFLGNCSWGRCYDLKFSAIFGEKIGVFLKNQLYDQIFA